MKLNFLDKQNQTKVLKKTLMRRFQKKVRPQTYEMFLERVKKKN